MSEQTSPELFGVLERLADVVEDTSAHGLEQRMRQMEDDLGPATPTPFTGQPGTELAQAARWMDVPSGEAVVTQGEVGDAFYLVAQGQLSVTVDRRLRGHTLGEGDGFGEISLLRRVPRTATIAALADCELLVIGAAQFLGSVTNNSDGAALAAHLAAARLAADSQDPAR